MGFTRKDREMHVQLGFRTYRGAEKPQR